MPTVPSGEVKGFNGGSHMNVSEDLMKVLMDQMKMIAHTETVVGQELMVGGMTIIPVSRVSMGVGVGGGGNDPVKANGGGGGIRIEPVAFLVVRDESVSLLNVGRGKGMDALFEKVPDLLDKIVEKLSDRLGKKVGKMEEPARGPVNGQKGEIPIA